MFEKAISVETLARSIATHADKQGWTSGHAAALDEAFAPLQGEITDHIDLGQIHASLNSLVSTSEQALAAAVKPLDGHRDQVLEYVEGLGEAAGAAHRQDSLQSVWDAMDKAWLDGMPCDRFVSFGENTPDCISWAIALDPHPANGYAQLRAAWLRGFSKAAGVNFEAPSENMFRISKAA